jgi:uncharacterized membrane protein HdeD (DUF308 family)
MVNLAVVGITLAVVAGIALAVVYFWRRRKWEGSLLLFLLPALAYFIWHFSVEAYKWGEIWATAKDISLELDIAVALIDLKLLFTVFMLIAWIYVWNSVNTRKPGSGSKK